MGLVVRNKKCLPRNFISGRGVEKEFISGENVSVSDIAYVTTS